MLRKIECRGRTFAALLWALALALCVGLAAPAGAQPATPETAEEATPEHGVGVVKDYGEISRTTYAISQEILSPFCPGKTLAMCPSPAAAEVRREIQAMASQGVEKEAIKAQIIETYGEEFRIVEPPASDNLALLTAIAVGLGLCILAVALISRRRKGQDGEPEAVASATSKVDEDDPYLAELRESYRD